jgi:hypothetical protein
MASAYLQLCGIGAAAPVEYPLSFRRSAAPGPARRVSQAILALGCCICQWRSYCSSWRRHASDQPVCLRSVADRPNGQKDALTETVHNACSGCPSLPLGSRGGEPVVNGSCCHTSVTDVVQVGRQVIATRFLVRRLRRSARTKGCSGLSARAGREKVVAVAVAVNQRDRAHGMSSQCLVSCCAAGSSAIDFASPLTARLCAGTPATVWSRRHQAVFLDSGCAPSCRCLRPRGPRGRWTVRAVGDAPTSLISPGQAAPLLTRPLGGARGECPQPQRCRGEEHNYGPTEHHRVSYSAPGGV